MVPEDVFSGWQHVVVSSEVRSLAKAKLVQTMSIPSCSWRRVCAEGVSIAKQWSNGVRDSDLL